MILISAQDVQKSFGTHEVLKGVSFSLQKGEKMGLVGVNGCGKTTLMRIISGEAEADGGIQEKEHGSCIPNEKFRTCIGSADSCAGDVHRGNGEFAANNEMELPVSCKYAEQAVTADNRAKNGGGNL